MDNGYPPSPIQSNCSSASGGLRVILITRSDSAVDAGLHHFARDPLTPAGIITLLRRLNPKLTKKEQCEQSELVHREPDDCILSLLCASCAVTLHRACRSQVWVRRNLPRRNFTGRVMCSGDSILSCFECRNAWWSGVCLVVFSVGSEAGLCGGLTGDRPSVGGIFGRHWCTGPTGAGYGEEKQEVDEGVRRVDLLWMVCFQVRNWVAKIIIARGLRKVADSSGGECRGSTVSQVHLGVRFIPSLGVCCALFRSLPSAVDVVSLVLCRVMVLSIWWSTSEAHKSFHRGLYRSWPTPSYNKQFLKTQ